MARWPLSLVVVLLAGCASSAPPDGTDAAHPTVAETDVGPADEGRMSIPGSPEDEPGPLDFMLWGQIKGVGTVADDGSNTFTGISSFPEEFTLGPGADLDVTLTWNLTAPALVYLIFGTPEREAIVLQGSVPDTQLERTLRHVQADAPAGVWSVRVRSQGPAVLDYGIHVVATYPVANATA